MKRVRRPLPPVTLPSGFARFRFPPEVIVLAVGWYLRYGLSYRDVEALLAERGVEVDHVTQQGWLVISRDFQIRENPAERRAVRESGARMVALSGEDARTTWGQFELLMTRWRRIEKLLDEPGPFIYQASRSRFQPLNLDG